MGKERKKKNKKKGVLASAGALAPIVWLGIVGVGKIWSGDVRRPSIERLGWEWPPSSWRPVGIRMAAGGSSTLRAEAARLVVVVIVYVLRVLGRW